MFDEDFVWAPNNELLLYRRVFKPGIDNLFFIALLQPLGARARGAGSGVPGPRRGRELPFLDFGHT